MKDQGAKNAKSEFGRGKRFQALGFQNAHEMHTFFSAPIIIIIALFHFEAQRLFSCKKRWIFRD